MSQIIIPWLEAKEHIREADVLLFRPKPFPSVGRILTAYTGGIHSHVALAHRDGDKLYCVEQKEFKGGRSVNLGKQVAKHKSRIDVYRTDSCIHIPEVEYSPSKSHASIEWVEKHFDEEAAHKVVEIALDMTGDPYGWRNIWEMGKLFIPGFRLLRSEKPDINGLRAYVCSTVITYSFRKVYADPCPNLSDTRTTPADIAQSALFHYLFTIGV